MLKRHLALRCRAAHCPAPLDRSRQSAAALMMTHQGAGRCCPSCRGGCRQTAAAARLLAVRGATVGLVQRLLPRYRSQSSLQVCCQRWDHLTHGRGGNLGCERVRYRMCCRQRTLRGGGSCGRLSRRQRSLDSQDGVPLFPQRRLHICCGRIRTCRLARRSVCSCLRRRQRLQRGMRCSQRRGKAGYLPAGLPSQPCSGSVECVASATITRLPQTATRIHDTLAKRMGCRCSLQCAVSR